MTGVAAEAVVTDHLTGSLEGIEELEAVSVSQNQARVQLVIPSPILFSCIV
jgi:hypothetical protein